MPSSPSASTRPATSGASGPTTTRSTARSLAARTSPSTSSAPTARHSTPSRAMPALPGAAISSGARGLRRSERTSACSRPPPPTTRTRTSESRDEVVDGDGDERLVARRAPRAELEGDARHRGLVGRLDDVHEVVLAERRPLGLDRGPELLDLLVHLLDARRVVLDRLHALRGQGAEHHERRHGDPFAVET